MTRLLATRNNDYMVRQLCATVFVVSGVSLVLFACSSQPSTISSTSTAVPAAATATTDSAEKPVKVSPQATQAPAIAATPAASSTSSAQGSTEVPRFTH